MWSKALTRDQREFVERTGSATVKTRVELIEAAGAYALLARLDRPLDEDARATAQEWVERIAVVWRVAEQAGITHAEFAEEFSTERTHLLLGAIQDSFILLAYRPSHEAQLLLDVNDLTNRVEELREDGAWEEGDIKPRDFPGPAERDRESFELASMRVMEAVAEASTFFPRLVDSRGPLEAGSAGEARSVLTELAIAGREAEAAYGLLVSEVDVFDPRPSLVLHRSMVQALVLRLSTDPERRALAIPLPDLGSRVVHVREGWKNARF